MSRQIGFGGGLAKARRALYAGLHRLYARFVRDRLHRLPSGVRNPLIALRKRFRALLCRGIEQVRMVHIETITACNLRCSYCPNSVYDRGLVKNTKTMQTELFRKIIDELADVGWSGEIQPHSYGEPLLDERLPELIGYAKGRIRSLKVRLFTNGELLTVPMYKQLVCAGVDEFSVTQHCPEPAGGVLDVLEYRESHGNDGVVFSYTRPTVLSNRGGLCEMENTVKVRTCEWPMDNLGIDYAGNVLICCHDYLHQVDVGNVRHESLAAIWNKPEYRELRRDIARGVFRHDMCRKCREQIEAS